MRVERSQSGRSGSSIDRTVTTCDQLIEMLGEFNQPTTDDYRLGEQDTVLTASYNISAPAHDKYWQELIFFGHRNDTHSIVMMR